MVLVFPVEQEEETVKKQIWIKLLRGVAVYVPLVQDFQVVLGGPVHRLHPEEEKREKPQFNGASGDLQLLWCADLQALLRIPQGLGFHLVHFHPVWSAKVMV